MDLSPLNKSQKVTLIEATNTQNVTNSFLLSLDL
jgi:hypothetical protein